MAVQLTTWIGVEGVVRSPTWKVRCVSPCLEGSANAARGEPHVAATIEAATEQPLNTGMPNAYAGGKEFMF
ncbi:hypothetical protein GCM10022403_079620 [Streptomyces coacervatus]|uniref:Uncharacterized protein n=1 Tax=Streptomyces coacervatus TaxID=647381 RepID=A0ABP7J629_9ACTN